MRRASAMSMAAARGARPGQLDQPVEIGADHAVFGRRVGHALQAAAAPCGPAPRPPRACWPCRWRLSSSAISGRAPSPSPSSFWMAASCSRSTASRWRSLERGLGLAADLGREAQHLQPLRPGWPRPCRAAPLRSTVSRISCFSVGLGVHVGGGDVGQRAGRVDRRRPSARSSGRRLRDQVEDLQRLGARLRNRASISASPSPAGSGMCRPRATR